MENGISVKGLFWGFVAGMVATVTVHELIKLALFNAGLFPHAPWNLEPALLTGIPQLASGALWGGLWGAVLAIILGEKPQGSMTLAGIIFGALGPALIGVFVVVPMLKGQPLFMGGDPTLIACVLMILAGFGAATAWLYGFFTAGMKLPD